MSVFFFNDTATTEIYTLSLHDALPIYPGAEDRAGAADPAGHRDDAGRVDVPEVAGGQHAAEVVAADQVVRAAGVPHHEDRKSTRLNSSHANISHAVFCLKKKKHYIPQH